MIYRFRVILNAKEDVFRDLELRHDQSLEDFHNSITQAFGFGGQEMASFFLSNDEWTQEEEFPLFDMSDGLEEKRSMSETALHEVLDDNQTKMIYIYDFLNYWTFLVELAEIADAADGVDYPNLIFAHGHLPEEPPATEFEGVDAKGGEFGHGEDADDFYEDNDDLDPYDLDELY
jgi:hypothetical protein